ncbi:MAG: hypothetical protein QGG67_08495 [Gammaproteobacteria bacterium]|jgi:hypothetical protein|nr:hypothetical protein [Gammaproteobacteria bacterium]MDP6096007.1 hypothetical protein [Gammaproteobacteria bacterium]|tara:strand:- start:258 stop:491 length:234 start_codon:yes stop_codon:yes gene_type:complete
MVVNISTPHWVARQVALSDFEALAKKYGFWRGIKDNPQEGSPFVLIGMDESWRDSCFFHFPIFTPVTLAVLTNAVAK